MENRQIDDIEKGDSGPIDNSSPYVGNGEKGERNDGAGTLAVPSSDDSAICIGERRKKETKTRVRGKERCRSDGKMTDSCRYKNKTPRERQGNRLLSTWPLARNRWTSSAKSISGRSKSTTNQERKQPEISLDDNEGAESADDVNPAVPDGVQDSPQIEDSLRFPPPESEQVIRRSSPGAFSCGGNHSAEDSHDVEDIPDSVGVDRSETLVSATLVSPTDVPVATVMSEEDKKWTVDLRDRRVKICLCLAVGIMAILVTVVTSFLITNEDKDPFASGADDSALYPNASATPLSDAPTGTLFPTESGTAT